MDAFSSLAFFLFLFFLSSLDITFMTVAHGLSSELQCDLELMCSTLPMLTFAEQPGGTLAGKILAVEAKLFAAG
jgi:hypothetical protein